MTHADHAALSALLARALGWPHVYPETRGGIAVSDHPDAYANSFRSFDYRDPSVALPVLEWLMRKHGLCVWGAVRGFNWSTEQGYDGNADTLPEAIARAAIAVADAKRQQIEQNEAREVCSHEQTTGYLPRQLRGRILGRMVFLAQVR